MRTKHQFSPHYSILPPEEAEHTFEKIRLLLESEDLETLFRGGCCYQWAMRINRCRLPKAFVTLGLSLSGEARQTHAYLKLSDGRCVDACGVFETEGELWEHWIKSKDKCQTELLSPEWLEEEISRRLPQRLNVAVMRAALKHFDSDAIFKEVRNA